MPGQSADTPNTASKPITKSAVCVHCHSGISPGAPRCAKCGGYQNWRRYLGLSGTVLSLLVALVSVSAFAIPAVMNAVRGQRSILRADLSFVTDNLAYLHFANQGGAPGLVESLALVVDRYEVDFEIDQLGQDHDKRLLRANEGGVIRIDARRLNSNGFRIAMASAEAEAYLDELAQWSRWSLQGENAFQEIGRGRSDAATKVPGGGLTAPRADIRSHEAREELSRDVRLALYRAQTRFAWIDPQQIRKINVDDWYDPRNYKDIESILENHGSEVREYLDPEAVELYVEVNTILAFLDAVFLQSEWQFVIQLRNSDGSRLEHRIPVDYSEVRRFLRPALLNARTVDEEWLAFFE